MNQKQLGQLTTEHDEQVAVIKYCDSHPNPDYADIYAVPNGGKRAIGLAVKLKAEGVRRGIPDLFLPKPRGEFHGLYIEMKKPGGRVSPEQLERMNRLKSDGYKTAICTSATVAISVIESYMQQQNGSLNPIEVSSKLIPSPLRGEG